MLMPIIAAVGSFIVSERILKPKATALLVLACLALYDLFISPPLPSTMIYGNATAVNVTVDTNDEFNVDQHIDEFTQHSLHSQQSEDLSTSLRCYRGPGLIAIALFCSAYSLRVWRRNGVACDELIFLPGTPHEVRIAGKATESGRGTAKIGGEGRDEMAVEVINEEEEGVELPRTDGIMRRSTSNNSTKHVESPGLRYEGDAAAGIFHLPPSNDNNSRSQLYNNNEDEEEEQSPLMTMQSWEETPTSNATVTRQQSQESPIISLALKGLDMLVISEQMERLRPPLYSDELHTTSQMHGDVKVEVYDAEYAPSGPSVLGAALDLSLPVLFNFHMFCVLMKDHYREEESAASAGMEASESELSEGDKLDIKEDSSFFTPPQLPPTVLPLIFLSSALVRSQIPKKQRVRFYKTLLQSTAWGIFSPISFRDAFVGECLTSLVRPIVDVVFAFTYYCVVLYGFLSRKWGLEESATIVSDSKLLHGLVLPTVAMIPLLCRLLQTLRQAYDSGKRWPHLGNAFKYYTAGLVVLYGMTHGTGERGTWWVVCFVAATIYQIVWDSCVDWELLVLVPSTNDGDEGNESGRVCCSNLRCPSIISSWSPRLFPSRLMGVLVSCRRIVTMPISNLCQRMSRLGRIRLRSQRMYDDESYYWRALFVNAALRFCWMMGFIPAYRISIVDGSVQETFSQSNSWTFVILATLEIVRCCIWGIIKVELETIKLSNGSDDDEYPREQGRWMSVNTEESLEKAEQTTPPPTPSYRWFGLAVSKGFLRWMYLLELSLWPVAFLVMGYYVAVMDFS